MISMRYLFPCLVNDSYKISSRATRLRGCYIIEQMMRLDFPSRIAPLVFHFECYIIQTAAWQWNMPINARKTEPFGHYERPKNCAMLSLASEWTKRAKLKSLTHLIFSPSALLFSKGCSSLYVHFIPGILSFVGNKVNFGTFDLWDGRWLAVMMSLVRCSMAFLCLVSGRINCVV